MSDTLSETLLIKDDIETNHGFNDKTVNQINYNLFNVQFTRLVC